MKRLWFVGILALLLNIPIPYSNQTTTESSTVISQTPQSTPERVYSELIIEDIYEAISETELRDIVEKITEDGSRFVDGPGDLAGPNRNARNYIIDQLGKLSNDRIEIEIIGDYYNVVGKLPGYLPGENPAFVVCAHFDSPDGCPGANCNGGGVAVMLTLARVMSQYEWPLDIYFMGFSGLHRHGPELTRFMEGSKEVSTQLRYRGLETLALFNVDTILFPHPSVSSDSRIQMGYNLLAGYTVSRYWAELTRTISNNYGSNSIIPVPSNIFTLWENSDHHAFSQKSFSGTVCAFESGYSVDTLYHTGYDVWDNPAYSYSLAKEVAGAIGGSMAYIMGRTYGESRRFDFSIITRRGNIERFYIPITTPTNIEVTCRWFGGPATFQLLNPNNQILESAVFDSPSAWEYTDLFNIPVSDQGLYTLILNNTGSQSVGFELTYSYDSDVDSNGILDSQEFWMNSVYFTMDHDSDGLSAAEELFLGTDDSAMDSDGDTMDDKFEVDYGLDPTDPSDGSADEDQDGLTNAQEYSAGLNLFSADSDSDLMPDLWELENGLNPLFDDSMLDADEDGKSNLQEYLDESDPQMEETEPIPIIWFIAPPVVIAVIVSFLYYRRKYY